jgi:hypothetical protein
VSAVLPATRPEARLAAADWAGAEADLEGQGWAVLPGILAPDECAALKALYGESEAFRSTVVMSRHGFGSGEYRYFRYPLPGLVAGLRTALYPRLLPVANAWRDRLGQPPFPPGHEAFLEACRTAGQTRPTPLLLRYREGDYNRLHQDLYGDQVFPLQAVMLLSAPGEDFEGGELVLTEQKPRSQSRAYVVPLRQGDVAVFAVNERPVIGARGAYRLRMRHGVSRLRRGERFTLGVIMHDAA